MRRTADFGASAAAVLYGSGAVVLFGVRSWRHRQATGRAGFNGFTRSRGRAARAAGMGFAAAVGLGLAAPVLARLHVLPLLGQPEHWAAEPLGLAGLVVTGAGFWAAALSQEAMGPSWRIGVDPAERTALVTEGVFGVVRNPIFTAMVVAQAGTVLMAPTWLGLAGLGLLLAAVQLQVRLVEEPYLAGVHGAAYVAYAARTGRFLPRLGRLRVADRSFFPSGVGW